MIYRVPGRGRPPIPASPGLRPAKIRSPAPAGTVPGHRRESDRRISPVPKNPKNCRKSEDFRAGTGRRDVGAAARVRLRRPGGSSRPSTLFENSRFFNLLLLCRYPANLPCSEMHVAASPVKPPVVMPPKRSLLRHEGVKSDSIRPPVLF